MSATFLPTETWLNIAASLDQGDHLSLISVCKDFYDIFLQPLYSSVTIELPLTIDRSGQIFGHSKFAAAGEVAGSLLDRLETHATIRSSVRNVCVFRLRNRGYFGMGQWEGDPTEPAYDVLVGDLMHVLVSLPGLREVSLKFCEIHVKWILYLAAQSSMQLDLPLTDMCLYGVPDGTSTTTKACSLSIRNTLQWREPHLGLAPFLLGPSLSSLDLRSLPSGTLHNIFILQNRPSYPHLRSLGVAYLKCEELEVLGALPNLQELMFYGPYKFWNADEMPHWWGEKRVLGLLETIMVHADLLPHLTTGRNITSITTEWPITFHTTHFENMERQFGSEMMVRTVRWEYCGETEKLLDYLIAKNPGVWDLRIDPIQEPSTQESIISYIPKLAQLRELRTLDFAVLLDIPSELRLSWEKEQCEHLRRIGSPFLTSVAFSKDTTWKRHPDDEDFSPSGS